MVHPCLTRYTWRSWGRAWSPVANITPNPSPPYCESLLEVVHPGLHYPPGDLGDGSPVPNTTSTSSHPYCDALLEVVHSGLPDPPGDLGGRAWPPVPNITPTPFTSLPWGSSGGGPPWPLGSTRRSWGRAWSPVSNTTPTPSPPYREALLEMVHPCVPDPPGDVRGRPGRQCLTPPYPLTSLPWGSSGGGPPWSPQSTRRSQGRASLPVPNTTPTSSPPYREALLEVVHPGLPLGTGLVASA